MNLDTTNAHIVGASPISDAQNRAPGTVRNRQGVPQSARVRLKKRGSGRRIRIGSWNVGSMTGKSMEIVDVMKRRRIDVLCVQETKWKGNRAREIGEGYKLIYYGTDTRRNGVGIICSREEKENVIEVRRCSSRCMSVRIATGEGVVNVVPAYASQTGCDQDEKDRFYDELNELIRNLPDDERVVVGADLNGACRREELLIRGHLWRKRIWHS